VRGDLFRRQPARVDGHLVELPLEARVTPLRAPEERLRVASGGERYAAIQLELAIKID
jgi:hypothetical protein